MTDESDTKDMERKTYYYCSNHGPIEQGVAIALDTKRGVKYQCPTCKSFLSPTPPEKRPKKDAGRQGIVPSKISADSVNRFCGNCGNIGQRYRIQPTKTGIINVCEACGSTVVPITDEVLASLPAPPDEEPIFPTEEPGGLAIPGGAGLDFTDVEAGRLQEVLSHSGVPSKRLGFILRVFQGTAAYRNPESLFAFLNSMGLGAARSKVAADYVFSSNVAQNVPMQAAPAQGSFSGLKERLIEAAIVGQELRALGLMPPGAQVTTDAQGNPTVAQAPPPAEAPNPVAILLQGMEMALKLNKGGKSIEDEIKLWKSFQSLTSPTTESAEVAGILGTVEIEKMKREDARELALAGLANDRAQQERADKTMQDAIKMGAEVVREIGKPFGESLGAAAKSAMTGAQQPPQEQGPTPAADMSPEQRNEVLSKLDEVQTQLDARRLEVASQDPPSVEVMRAKDGGHLDIHEQGGS